MIFIKNPIPGKVKTRLAKEIGDERALLIYEQLTDITFQVTRNIDFDKAVFYSDSIDYSDKWTEDKYHKRIQQGGTLGDRMQYAFQQGFDEKYNSVVIIGSDCPHLTTDLIYQAFDLLDTYDFVIGPAKDGGYYLLGMNALQKNLFENKKWSTDTVLQDTLNDIKGEKASYILLPVLSDIDNFKDLKEFDISSK